MADKDIAADTARPSSDANQPASSNQTELTPRPRPGADAALDLLKSTNGLQRSLDPSLEKSLKRKIDLWVMPLICIVYFLQYIDKTAISYSSVTGLQQSTNLHGNQFNWVASIFFFGYV